MNNIVEKYYEDNAMYEWERLIRPYQRFEYEGTLALFDRYLNNGIRKICEVGAGPGRYSLELLRRGHHVTLVDLSSNLLEIAKREITGAGFKADDYICDDASHLGKFDSHSFDAILLLGPMYHIIDSDLRSATLAGAYNALKPGGVLFSAYINSYALLLTGIEEFPQEFDSPQKIATHLKPLRQTGLEEGERGFQAFFSPPEYAVEEIGKAGFSVISYAGVEGVAGGARNPIRRCLENSPQTYDALLEFNAAVIELSPFRDIASHIMVIARKPECKSALESAPMS
jgi:S-adenosylmethionine-dependent methyltransferase